MFILLIMYFFLHSQVEEFYNDGINYPCEEIILSLKLKYLQWSKEYIGLTATRKLFKELNDMEPVCINLYMSMISYEKSFNTPNVSLISNLYSDACRRFGQKDISKCLHISLAIHPELIGILK